LNSGTHLFSTVFISNSFFPDCQIVKNMLV
jgi:hypothetical protein